MTTTRSTTTVTVTVLLVAALAGCGGGAAGGGGPTGGTSASDPPSSASRTAGPPRTAPDGSAIPDGTWAKTMTAADAAALGLPAHEAQKHLGADGENVIELRFAGADWAQFMEEDGAPGLVLGDRGTSGYDAQGRWVPTSLSEGCAGCTAAFIWSVEGDRLTLRLADVDTAADPIEVLVSRLVMEGTFTRR